MMECARAMIQRGLLLYCYILYWSIKWVMEEGKRGNRMNIAVRRYRKEDPSAVHLYEKLGFVKPGVVSGGFLIKDGSFEDIFSFTICCNPEGYLRKGRMQ